MQSRISLPPFVKVNFDVVISEEKVCIATIGKNHKWEVIFVLGKDIRRSRAINSRRLEAKAAYLATEKWKGSRIRYEAFNLWRKLSKCPFVSTSHVLTTQTVTFISASQTLSFFKKHFLQLLLNTQLFEKTLFHYAFFENSTFLKNSTLKNWTKLTLKWPTTTNLSYYPSLVYCKFYH